MEMKEQISMKQSLYKALKPLYAELLGQLSEEDKSTMCPFCMQWGKDFPTNPSSGLLFVGRATNGYSTDATKSVDVLFDGEGESLGFARPDQMTWLETHSFYNWRQSPFWRVISKVSQDYTEGEWFNGIAWSNLCKIAPSEAGNPSDRLYYAQLSACQKILKSEIEILSPKFVILLTGNSWAKDFLSYLDDKKTCSLIDKVEWGNNYTMEIYLINGVYFLRTEHPQGKPEQDHIEVIKLIIEKYK